MSDENESIAVRSVKLPTFDGTHSSFQIWWMRFVAFATVHRFASAASKEGPEEDLPESEGSAIPAITLELRRDQHYVVILCHLPTYLLL